MHHDSTKVHKGIEIEKFTAHGSWRKYIAYIKGPQKEVKAGCRRREQQDMGTGLH